MREVGKGSLRTRLGREKVLVFYQVLYPCHNIINVRRRRQVYALALLVDPWIAQTKNVFRVSRLWMDDCGAHLAPADIVGHALEVQHSTMVP